jgi:hypothetical protein
MDPTTEQDTPESTAQKPLRRPSTRGAALLAAAMLGVGIAVGAAIGPAPQSSLGAAAGLAQRLPLLIAGIDSHRRSTTPTATSPAGEEAPSAVEATAARHRKRKARPAAASTPESSEPSSEESSSAGSETKKQTKKLPAVTSVWLIELAGGSFEAALTQASAAPYVNTQLLPQATLLKGWSALDGSAFASEAAIAEPPSAGSTPPLLHSIVQPPCPEGAAGASCAAETPGQLTAADEFLKTTLASITGTSTYKEHGLVVITFATVGIATQSELPAGASTATLTYQPPAGVALLSPFVRGGQRSTVAFNPTSPRQSLEKLLH